MQLSPISKPCLLFDWGDTLMRVFPGASGAMADWPQVEAMPGVLETLPLLQAGWRMVLATNAADSDAEQIRKALQRVGLDRWIERIYCFRLLGLKKPDPAYFQAILQDLQLAPVQAVMVGDQVEADITGARQAGLSAVWCNFRDQESLQGPGVATIHDFRQLPGALLRLVSGD